MKKIYFEDKIPFCNYHEGEANKKIRFHSIHCLTWGKLYIKKLYKNKDLNFNPYYRKLNVFKSKIKKYSGSLLK